MMPDLAMQKVERLDVGRKEMYPRILDRLYRNTAVLPPNQFCEVRFEALEKEPAAELERVHQALELPG
ncbi:MAG: hypothetical protein M2R45_03441 [Verrucomicrobia subdivision 3 bacterium]|nr:hypothetical protein [Limisphaerales bacterium]MCS1415741.1 hypothetical protein [Limisphaerales bacterium]